MSIHTSANCKVSPEVRKVCAGGVQRVLGALMQAPVVSTSDTAHRQTMPDASANPNPVYLAILCVGMRNCYRK